MLLNIAFNNINEQIVTIEKFQYENCYRKMSDIETFNSRSISTNATQIAPCLSDLCHMQHLQ